MTAYWIAHVTIHDLEQYKKYAELAKDVFPQYGATFLVRDEDAYNLEGPAYARHVVIQFPSMEKALECYNSEAYQTAKKHRDSCSEALITLTHHLNA